MAPHPTERQGKSMTARRSTPKATTPEATTPEATTPEAEAPRVIDTITGLPISIPMAKAEGATSAPEAITPEATTPAEAEAEADPIATYRAKVAEAIDNADKATGTLPETSRDALRRALVALKPSERMPLVFAVDAETMAKATSASPVDVPLIMAAQAIRAAVSELAQSKAKALADPVADAAFSFVALRLAAAKVYNDLGGDDMTRWDAALAKAEAEAHEATRALVAKLVKVATHKGAATTSATGERADVIGFLVDLVGKADEGDTWTVAPIAKAIGCSTGSVQAQIDNLSERVAKVGGIPAMVDNGKGRMVKGIRKGAEAEAMASWAEAKAKADHDAHLASEAEREAKMAAESKALRGKANAA